MKKKKCLLKKKDSRERPCPFHQLWAQDEDGIPLQRRSILASSAWPCSLWEIHSTLDKSPSLWAEMVTCAHLVMATGLQMNEWCHIMDVDRPQQWEVERAGQHSSGLFLLLTWHNLGSSGKRVSRKDCLDHVGQRGMCARILLFILTWKDLNVGGTTLWFGARDHIKIRGR